VELWGHVHDPVIVADEETCSEGEKTETIRDIISNVKTAKKNIEYVVREEMEILSCIILNFNLTK